MVDAPHSRPPRLAWPDFLRAFLIFIVVADHSRLYIFGADAAGENPLLAFLTSFYMPAFFFISGIFAKPFNDVTRNLKRVFLLAVPFVVVGSIYVYFYRFAPWSYLFTNRMHSGYWFLWSLLFINILFMGRNAWVQRCRRVPAFAADVAVIALAEALCVVAPRLLGAEAASVLSLDMSKYYIPYYFAGFWYGAYVLRRESRMRSRALGAMSVLMAAAGYAGVSFASEGGPAASAFAVLQTLGATLLLTGVFRALPFSWPGAGIVRCIGSHTLEIYVLHYLLLSPAARLAPAGLLGGGPCRDFAVYGVVALGLIAVLLPAILLLRKSRWLSAVLFGRL